MSHTIPASSPFAGPGIGLRAAAAALVLGIVAPVPPAAGQEAPRMTADADLPAPNRDAGALAAYGLDLATLEQIDDAALLWRVVRELVLPGKVSEATQQRVLRRVWVADPVVRNGSYIDSPAN